jgi:hypothetical protein
VDVTSSALGGSGTAVGAVVGADGAVIEVGDLGLGGGPGDISGASISIPAGSVPAGTPIFIGSAPPLDPKGAPTPIGAAVSFGPDGQKFATPVTITIPVTNTSVPAGDVAVFTRSGSGKVSEVEEPLTIDPVTGAVSFPASHFSDYVVVSRQPVPSFSTLLTDVFDVALGPVPSVPGSLYVISEDTLVYTVTFSAASGYQRTLYAGGGAQMSDGTARLAFDFNFDVSAIHVAGSKVYVAAGPAVYVVDDALGTVSRVFGTGVSGDSGDGGPAVAAEIRGGRDIQTGPGGSILIVDQMSARIRRLTGGGDAETLAGNGTSAAGPDGSDALLTSLDDPECVSTVLDGGAVYVAELGRLRRVDRFGAITTIAGHPLGQTGCVAPTAGARTARFTALTGVSAYFDTQTSSTRVYVADAGCSVIWRVDPDLDEIELVAGTLGMLGITPDGAGVGALFAPGRLIGFSESSFVFIEAGNGRKVREYTKPQ